MTSNWETPRLPYPSWNIHRNKGIRNAVKGMQQPCKHLETEGPTYTQQTHWYVRPIGMSEAPPQEKERVQSKPDKPSKYKQYNTAHKKSEVQSEPLASLPQKVAKKQKRQKSKTLTGLYIL